MSSPSPAGSRRRRSPDHDESTLRKCSNCRSRRMNTPNGATQAHYFATTETPNMVSHNSKINSFTYAFLEGL
ncbi:hypothetical protein V8E54_007157 [Elaphomyces granulatus]